MGILEGLVTESKWSRWLKVPIALQQRAASELAIFQSNFRSEAAD